MELTHPNDMFLLVEHWPVWPKLPLKSTTKSIFADGGLSFAMAYDVTKGIFKVYIGDMIDNSAKELDDAGKTKTYESLAALFEEWTVD